MHTSYTLHTHFIHTPYTLHTHFIHTSYTLYTHFILIVAPMQNLEVTTKWACAANAGTQTCKAPSAKGAGGGGGTVFVALFFGLGGGYV